MTPHFETDRENLMVLKDKLEEAVTNLSIQIEGSEEISEQGFRNIDVHIKEVQELIRQLNDEIYFS